MKRDVVIIGGGPAGRIVVHALHASEKSLSVTLIKDEEVNVNRCAIPYGIGDDNPLRAFQIPNTLVTDFGAELVVDQVVSVDAEDSSLQTASGKRYEYHHLVWATGARPLVPPIPGVDATGIVPVRSLRDLEQLRQRAEQGGRAVVVGGGYIGVEVAIALHHAGMDVTLVEMLPHILMMTSEPEFIAPIETTLTEKGMRLLTGSKVMAFEQNNGKVCAARLDADRRVEADLVVLAVGVVPNTELAKDSGLATSPYGIVTDSAMRIPGHPNMYAAGDCAAKLSYINGQPTRGEFGTNATFMARVAAQNILGNDVTFPGVINTNASTAFEWSTGSAGMTEAMARDAGMDVVCGCSKVHDRYPMMDGLSEIHTKLVFDRANRNLIGGSILRKGLCAAAHVDFISLAIQMGATVDDLVNYQYATHPELAAKPSDNTVVFACRDAMKQWERHDESV
ncbi:MAG: NADH oxidase [Spartobacteria bacterium]|nr:NADH oxidase [Spartobacteria bacterium]